MRRADVDSVFRHPRGSRAVKCEPVKNPKFLEKTFQDNTNKIAIISAEQQYTYDKIDQMSSSVAQSLSNFPKNSVISMMLENSIEEGITKGYLQ